MVLVSFRSLTNGLQNLLFLTITSVAVIITVTTALDLTSIVAFKESFSVFHLPDLQFYHKSQSAGLYKQGKILSSKCPNYNST